MLRGFVPDLRTMDQAHRDLTDKAAIILEPNTERLQLERMIALLHLEMEIRVMKARSSRASSAARGY
jgi:hypothetical protein